VVRHSYPDHHAYTADEARKWGGEGVVVTTEKDAVKLADLGVDGWALVVEAVLEPGAAEWLAALPCPTQGSGPCDRHGRERRR
jgi:tetraacyldisaccharide 4'-kinase